MKDLRNIKTIPFEIGQLLAKNPTLCGLMLDDSNDPKTIESSFSSLLNNHYINMYPPIESGDIQDYNKSSYIIILIDTINTNNGNQNISVTGHIYVTTDLNHILLTNNKNRLLEMSDQVFKTLNGEKLTSSGELRINYISYTVINNFRSAYRISFEISDQQIERTEI